ncbi:condensin complex protein MksE [Massilia sp. TWR1-2-2]|uniref:condensin complex protein MksE n=1 Tax=Massilia sp. TWR1-2-2 TaxID=2804584 RepID=UPI003CE79839
MNLNYPPAPIALDKLTRLKDLFAMLNAGRHVNRLAEPVLWAELEREAAQYERVFGALGYELRIDGRGYAWFQTGEASGTVSKATRQLALLFMLIFEQQADAGQHLGRFVEWRIDRPLLTALLDKNRALLDAEGLAELDALQQLLDTAVRYGFADAANGAWRLLPAVFRYLDRFEELAGNADLAGESIALAAQQGEAP